MALGRKLRHSIKSDELMEVNQEESKQLKNIGLVYLKAADNHGHAGCAYYARIDRPLETSSPPKIYSAVLEACSSDLIQLASVFAILKSISIMKLSF